MGALFFCEARSLGASLGATLTVIYSTECLAPNPKTTKRPASLLPLLVILFIVSYGILTLLVFEQGQTIESQRGFRRPRCRRPQGGRFRESGGGIQRPRQGNKTTG